MPILSGQVVTVNDLNHLKPATYYAASNANLPGIVVNTDVPGATVTFTTETDNAVYVVNAFFDMDWQGAAAVGNLITGMLYVDGAHVSGDTNGEQAAGANGDRLPGSHVWQGTLALAGSHTAKLVASIPVATQRIANPHTAIQVTVYEVV